MLNRHYIKYKKVEILTAHNTTDITISIVIMNFCFEKKRAAKKDPIGIEIKTGVITAKPKNPILTN